MNSDHNKARLEAEMRFSKICRSAKDDAVSVESSIGDKIAPLKAARLARDDASRDAFATTASRGAEVG